MGRRMIGEVTIERDALRKAFSDLADKVGATGAKNIDMRLCQDGATAELVLFEAGTENRIAKVNAGRIND